jgi:hypothetical protein
MFRCRLSTLLLLVVLAALGLAMVAEYRQADRRMSEHRDRLAAEVFYGPAITLGSCYLLVAIGVWLECRMKLKAQPPRLIVICWEGQNLAFRRRL